MNIWVLLAAVPALGFGLVGATAMMHARKIAKQRRGLTINDFFREFAGAPYSQEAIKIAYEDLTREIKHPVKRFDLLYPTLSFGAENVEDLILRRGDAEGINDVFNSSFLQECPVKTVDNYVRFVDWILTKPQIDMAG